MNALAEFSTRLYMESLIQQVLAYRSGFTAKELSFCLDLTKLNSSTLLGTVDPSKLTLEELKDILVIETDEHIIKLLKKLIFNKTLPLTAEDFKQIEFDKFSDSVQKNIMSGMLRRKFSIDMICTLLEQMKSVNYGTSVIAGNNINPLNHSCWTGNQDLVKLLVERFGANIEYLSANGKTAIMYSSATGHEEITKYLYDLGAKQKTATCNVIDCSTPAIRQLIIKWQDDKRNKQMETIMQDLNDLQIKHESLKSNYRDLVKDHNIALKDLNDAKIINDRLNEMVQSKYNDENYGMGQNYFKIINHKNNYNAQ